MRLVPYLMLAITLLLLPADASPVLAQETPPPPTVTVADPATAAPLALDPDPVLTLGSATEAGPELFDRPVAVRRLDDGSIVVADQGASELRVFAEDGRFLRRMGRQGDGPGEFRNLADVFTLADTLFAWDAGHRRLTVFAPDGEVARTVPVQPGEDGRLPHVAGVLSGSRLVVRASRPVRASGGASGILRDSVHVTLHDPEGRLLTALATLPGEETFVVRRGRSVSVTDLPFAHRGLLAVRGGRTVLATTDAYRLGLYDAEGTPEMSIAAPVRPGEVTADLLDQAREREVARLREIGFYDRMRENVEAKYEAIPRGRQLPALTALVMGTDGRTWARLSHGLTGAERWAVHRGDGSLEGTVVLPDGVRLMDAGPDRVLGTFTDALGVAYVGVWRLQ